MTKDEYQTYLQTDHWKLMARLTKERDGHRCRFCGSSDYLVAHHISYTNMPYKESLNDLSTLCEECHTHFHQWKNGDLTKNDPSTAYGIELTVRVASGKKYTVDMTDVIAHGKVIEPPSPMDVNIIELPNGKRFNIVTGAYEPVVTPPLSGLQELLEQLVPPYNKS
jgi:hypothetical protein